MAYKNAQSLGRTDGQWRTGRGIITDSQEWMYKLSEQWCGHSQLCLAWPSECVLTPLSGVKSGSPSLTSSIFGLPVSRREGDCQHALPVAVPTWACSCAFTPVPFPCMTPPLPRTFGSCLDRLPGWVLKTSRQAQTGLASFRIKSPP